MQEQFRKFLSRTVNTRKIPLELLLQYLREKIKKLEQSLQEWYLVQKLIFPVFAGIPLKFSFGNQDRNWHIHGTSHPKVSYYSALKSKTTSRNTLPRKYGGNLPGLDHFVKKEKSQKPKGEANNIGPM